MDGPHLNPLEERPWPIGVNGPASIHVGDAGDYYVGLGSDERGQALSYKIEPYAVVSQISGALPGHALSDLIDVPPDIRQAIHHLAASSLQPKQALLDI